MREGRENERVCPYYNLFSCDAEQQSAKNLENVYTCICKYKMKRKLMIKIGHTL